MKAYIMIIITALVIASAVVHESTQDIQRAMRSQHRARRSRRRKTEGLELFIDY